MWFDAIWDVEDIASLPSEQAEILQDMVGVGDN